MCEFKIGDWVIDKYVSFAKPFLIRFDVEIDNYVKDECKLWQPKEGEWCWFKDEKNTIGSLTQLVGIEKDGTYYGYSSCGMPDKAPCAEPFIGELPSFIKKLKESFRR